MPAFLLRTKTTIRPQSTEVLEEFPANVRAANYGTPVFVRTFTYAYTIAFIVFVVSRHGNLSPETTNSFLVPLMLNSVFLCPFCLTTLI